MHLGCGSWASALPDLENVIGMGQSSAEVALGPPHTACGCGARPIAHRAGCDARPTAHHCGCGWPHGAARVVAASVVWHRQSASVAWRH
eukprot:2162238-Prymnesium_polylepis.2